MQLRRLCVSNGQSQTSGEENLANVVKAQVPQD